MHVQVQGGQGSEKESKAWAAGQMMDIGNKVDQQRSLGRAVQKQYKNAARVRMRVRMRD